ncbi:MAG: helix-turn-helix domain-containing protein [Rhodospirillales bacterium]
MKITTSSRRTKTRSQRFRKKRLPPGVPNPVDIHVGSRVRLRRTLLGLSQEKLGDAVGLTFQQIQKYERGANRIGASRLFQLSRILDVPISFFFDEMPAGLKTTEGQVARGLRERDQKTLEPDPLARRETLELVRAYYRISDPRVRKRLFELTKALANASRNG